MNQFTTSLPTLKELEEELFRQLQKEYVKVMEDLLSGIDESIMKSRDKTRFRHLGKRTCTMDTLFGSISIERNYYKDREKGNHVGLLDRYLQFNGADGVSPHVAEMMIELAVQGPSYRAAADTMEKLLGYRVTSHEWIRQKLLSVELPSKEERFTGRVLFVEVDGVHIPRQGKHRRSKEEKMAAVHQGWMINGKRVSLKDKRHFHHEGGSPFWEAFEDFLYDTYAYDPMTHVLVINGDQASWIQEGQDYFGTSAYVVVDRYHVAKEVRSLFKGHRRKKYVQRALLDYDVERFHLELTTAVGTMETDEHEQKLEALIRQVEARPDAFRDYRVWLQSKGIDTTGMRGMGSAESTMRTFAND